MMPEAYDVGMALLIELVLMVLVIGVLGGLVAALAERTSRPGTVTIREIVATAFAGRGRSSRRVPSLRPRSTG